MAIQLTKTDKYVVSTGKEYMTIKGLLKAKNGLNRIFFPDLESGCSSAFCEYSVEYSVEYSQSEKHTVSFGTPNQHCTFELDFRDMETGLKWADVWNRKYLSYPPENLGEFLDRIYLVDSRTSAESLAEIELRLTKSLTDDDGNLYQFYGWRYSDRYQTGDYHTVRVWIEDDEWVQSSIGVAVTNRRDTIPAPKRIEFKPDYRLV
jgi:hypothetical protein